MYQLVVSFDRQDGWRVTIVSRKWKWSNDIGKKKWPYFDVYLSQTMKSYEINSQSLENVQAKKAWKSLGTINQSLWPTKWDFHVNVDLVFYCRPPCRPPCRSPCPPPCWPPYSPPCWPPQCRLDALWGLRDADRMEIRKYHLPTYRRTYRGRC